MSYNLFLDDERHPRTVTWMYNAAYQLEEWRIVESQDAFERAVNAFGVPAFVSFDHDLAVEDDEETGLTTAKWLVEYCHENEQSFPLYAVHSMNPVGKGNIEGYIEAALAAGYVNQV